MNTSIKYVSFNSLFEVKTVRFVTLLQEGQKSVLVYPYGNITS